MSNPNEQAPSPPPEDTISTQTTQSTSTTTTPPSQFKLIQTSTLLSTMLATTPTTTTVLLHATNAFGTWGAGFAKALQRLYPSAEKVYKSWCDETRPSPDQWPSRELVGRCLVVPPQEGDRGTIIRQVWIGCLFTSYGYGGRAVRGGKAGGGGHAAKDGVGSVVASTKVALEELRGWVRRVEDDGIGGDGGEDVEDQKSSKVVIYSPKFNSGNFGVDWEVTANMIREVFGDWDGDWRILAGS